MGNLTRISARNEFWLFDVLFDEPRYVAFGISHDIIEYVD